MKTRVVPRALLVLSLTTLFICNAANAVIVNNLYSVNLNVADNTNETRAKQLPLALEEVLLKVGSSNLILESKELAVAKQQVDKYVDGYSYKQNDELYKLSIQFNDKMISQLLSKLGRGFLGKNRPLILLRLDDGQTHPDVVTNLESLSARYGIPIIIPSLDLSEMHLDAAHVGEIASRYRADIVMSGKINNDAGEWHCEWQLFNNDRLITWSSNGGNLESQLELMINQLADQLVAQRSNTTVHKRFTSNKISLRIDGVNNIGDYAKITAYLKNLAPVKKVEVKAVSENQLVFLISADGGKEAIVKAISLDRLLTANVVGDDTESLSYKVNS